MMGLSLDKYVLLSVKPSAEPCCTVQKFLVFRGTFIDISGKHPVIGQNDPCPCKQRQQPASGKII